jgi:hypothetical protein
MTDRLKGLLVTFEKDIRDDDAQARIDAIKQIKGVISVKPLVADYVDYMARERVEREMQQKLWDTFNVKP